MEVEQERAIRQAVTDAMEALAPEEIRELIFEPYRSVGGTSE